MQVQESSKLKGRTLLCILTISVPSCLTHSSLFTREAFLNLSMYCSEPFWMHLRTYRPCPEGAVRVANVELFIDFSLYSWWVVSCSWQWATCSLNILSSEMKSSSICYTDVQKKKKREITSLPHLHWISIEQGMSNVCALVLHGKASDLRSWEIVPKSELHPKQECLFLCSLFGGECISVSHCTAGIPSKESDACS